MADLEYLEPDFNPTSLTIPKLRSLLVEYDVPYPSSAKKAQLVELFEENIRPRAKRILSAHARTKPSTRGIKDVPSSQASAADEDVGEAMPPPTKSPTKRKSRRVTEGPVEVDEEPTPRVPASAPAKRTSSKHVRTSEGDTDAQLQRRRSRKSAVKMEEPEPEGWHREDADSPFTSENPFQSGSSPPPPESRDRRRKTLDPTEEKAKRKSSGGRRKTDVFTAPQTDGALVRSRKSYEVPVSRLKQEEDEFAGEEFTPEEQLALVRARAANGEVDTLPPRRRKAPSRVVGALKMFTSFGGLATLLGLAAVWRQEKLEVGYCGVGRPSTQIAGLDIPEWAEVIRPHCEPCPPHAYCYGGLRTECEPDFVLQQHPLALNGLVPVPPTCEPDSEKQRRVKAVADRAVEELRIRNAEYECGDLKDSSGKPAPNSQIAEDELKAAVSTKRRRGMSQQEFEDLWKAAIGDIAGRDEVSAGSDGTNRTLLASTSLARVGLSCYIRRSVRAALVRHLWQLIGVLLFLGSLTYGRYSITAGRREEAEAKRLAAYAFDRLATQAALHAADGTKYPEGFISMANMRDDPTLSKNTIGKSLWEKVQKKVEKNSNIRPMVRESRNGDIARVWEWIGPVAAIEDGGSSRRQSGRYSLGTGYDSTMDESPYAMEQSKPLAGQEMVERRSWNEGRPIY